MIFDNLEFHPDISDTLKTIKSETFKEHTFQIVQGLQTLKYSQDTLPPSTSNNDADLIKISEWSSKFGVTSLSCTKQGKNKPKYDFCLGNIRKNTPINCEFHLKLNFNNSGIKIEERDDSGRMYNRLYFGIHMHHGIKKLLVAHIGKHL